MKYGSRSRTNAQQAPASPFGPPRHASRSVPLHTASMNRNRITGGMTRISRPRMASVSRVLSGDENRFARSQPIGPVVATGAGRTGRRWLCTKMSSSVTPIPNVLVSLVLDIG